MEPGLSRREPAWYGRRYPTHEDLETLAAELGCWVDQTALGKAAFVVGEAGEPPVILVPGRHGPLEQAWALAHELGHLVQHAGPKGELRWSQDEAAANRWAARALIPEAAIRRHRNASQDALVAALWRHFEEFPLEDCPVRRLAGRIAQLRLKALEVVA